MKKILIFLLCAQGFCCTDFILPCEDGSMIVGRSLEFAQLLPTRIKSYPRGQKMQSAAPQGQQGMSWTSKYGYTAMAVFKSEIVADGFNEEGLSFGLLWFPDAEYPKEQGNRPVLSYVDLGPYLLGNFKTVAQAMDALEKVFVYSYAIPEFQGVMPIHISLHDAQGNSGVIEFVNGEVRKYKNSVGVLTNAPSFPWQVTNLRNYINLTAINSGTARVDGTVLEPSGQGTGLLGIPGDWTPPSRFVRIAIFKDFLLQPQSAKMGAISAVHLLNTVDIPFGDVREKPKRSFDYTQWAIIKDLTHGKLYVRTYLQPNFQLIDTNQWSFEEGSPVQQIELATP